MGTRNLTCVVLDGEYRVAQYGQWDGDPEGQGATILEFLRTRDLKEFAKQVAKCSFIANQSYYDDLCKELGIKTRDCWISTDDARRFGALHPELSRDTGGKILELIQNAQNGLILDNDIGFVNNSLFCEWAYVVDLDKGTLEVYKGCNKRRLGKDQRFYSDAPPDDKYYPIRLAKAFDLNALPTRDKFLAELKDK